MLSGLLVCVPCILIVKRLLRLNESVLDAYTFVLPFGNVPSANRMLS